MIQESSAARSRAGPSTLMKQWNMVLQCRAQSSQVKSCSRCWHGKEQQAEQAAKAAAATAADAARDAGMSREEQARLAAEAARKAAADTGMTHEQQAEEAAAAAASAAADSARDAGLSADHKSVQLAIMLEETVTQHVIVYILCGFIRVNSITY